ncbi:MAG TPA: PilZ domain-containing protein [Myxococcota bacterium]|nr:PilZ domain-containing protein [Myxococcota bacterium]
MSRESAQPRTRCRLPCTIRAGRGRAHSRVLDVSSGGLCFVAPVCFRLHTRVQVEIVAPRSGPIAVEGDVRHRRPFHQPSSGRRGWATGLALATAGPDFLALTSPGALPPPSDSRPIEVLQPATSAVQAAPVAARLISPDLLVEEQSLYRVRLKAVASARTRTLTLRAVSESAVCEAVLRDLSGDWEVLGVELDPID